MCAPHMEAGHMAAPDRTETYFFHLDTSIYRQFSF
jgi:hypothetical protein